MSDTVKTIRVKSTHPESQGAFVEINEADFDKSKHELYEGGDEGSGGQAGPKDPLKMKHDELVAELADRNVEHKANASNKDLAALLTKARADAAASQ